ncbi:MAG: PP2C family protein-serine/threonine phosphatase [Candidatus Zipacnadales bacterium]
MSSSPRREGVILVVNNDPAIRLLLRECLLEWQVEEATDGQAALDLARQLKPDLIIADWAMPRLSGPEMVKQLRHDPQLGHIPVVMLTGYTDVEHRAASYHSGADHFLPRDFAPAELLAIIERAVDRTRPLTLTAPLLEALDSQLAGQRMAEIGEAMALVAEFQQQMLPPPDVRLGQLSLGASLVPSVIASGDFYDYVLWDEGRQLGFVVGDVSGHGLAASYFMVMVRTALRVLRREQRPLGEMISSMNDILVTETPVGWFVTLFYGIADPATGTLQYVNAGHCPTLRCRPCGSYDLLKPTGPALGIFPGHSYTERTLVLDERDCLICLTDGVIDAVRSEDPDERYQWVVRIAQQHSGRRAQVIARTLTASACAEAKEGHRDDLTALVIKRSDQLFMSSSS